MRDKCIPVNFSLPFLEELCYELITLVSSSAVFYYPSLHSVQIQTIYICHRSGHKNETHLTCPLGMESGGVQGVQDHFLRKIFYCCVFIYGLNQVGTYQFSFPKMISHTPCRDKKYDSKSFSTFHRNGTMCIQCCQLLASGSTLKVQIRDFQSFCKRS